MPPSPKQFILVGFLLFALLLATIAYGLGVVHGIAAAIPQPGDIDNKGE